MCTYYDNEYNGVDISEETLDGITFENCIFKNCVAINTILKNCRFNECTFEDCRLSNVVSYNSVIAEVNFNSCSIQGIAFEDFTDEDEIFNEIERINKCTVRLCSFSDLKLKKIDITENMIEGTNFNACELQGTSFNNNEFKDGVFLNCKLNKCDFRDSRGYVMDPRNNEIKDARFTFPEVTVLLDSFGIKIEY